MGVACLVRHRGVDEVLRGEGAWHCSEPVAQEMKRDEMYWAADVGCCGRAVTGGHGTKKGDETGVVMLARDCAARGRGTRSRRKKRKKLERNAINFSNPLYFPFYFPVTFLSVFDSLCSVATGCGTSCGPRRARVTRGFTWVNTLGGTNVQKGQMDVRFA